MTLFKSNDRYCSRVMMTDEKNAEKDKGKEMVSKGGIELLKERSCSAHHNVYAR